MFAAVVIGLSVPTGAVIEALFLHLQKAALGKEGVENVVVLHRCSKEAKALIRSFSSRFRAFRARYSTGGRPIKGAASTQLRTRS